jgi:hypothetical protein
MIEDYLTVPVHIKRARSADQWGEPTAAAPLERIMAHVAPSSRRITTEAGEQVVASEVFALPPGTVVTYHDRLVVNGVERRPLLIRRPRSLDGEESVRVFVA